MLAITPGDPAELLLGERATEETLETMREHLGLNEPLYVQYGMFLKRLIKLIWARPSGPARRSGKRSSNDTRRP